MTRYRYESFAGFRLLVYANELQDEEMILRVKYSIDGTWITFTTETGDHTFYYKGEELATELADGWWRFTGDSQWAYVIKEEACDVNDQASTTVTRCPANKWYLFNLHVKEDENADFFPMGEVRECHIEGGEIHFVTDRGTFVFLAQPLDEHPTHFLDGKGKEAILFPPSSV